MAEHKPENLNADGIPVDEDDPDGAATFYVGAVGLVILVACVAAVSGLYYWLDDRQHVESVNNVESAALQELRAGQRANLQREGRQATADGKVVNRVPIAKAKENVIKKYAK